jgi:glycine/D-amino acid oxidase-like deaminating enzyme
MSLLPLHERNVRDQQSREAVVNLMSPSELKQKYPSMNVSELGVGAHTPHDRWCDPQLRIALRLWRRPNATGHGQFRTLDMSRLGYQRVGRNEPYSERRIL